MAYETGQKVLSKKALKRAERKAEKELKQKRDQSVSKVLQKQEPISSEKFHPAFCFRFAFENDGFPFENPEEIIGLLRRVEDGITQSTISELRERMATEHSTMLAHYDQDVLESLSHEKRQELGMGGRYGQQFAEGGIWRFRLGNMGRLFGFRKMNLFKIAWFEEGHETYQGHR